MLLSNAAKNELIAYLHGNRTWAEIDGLTAGDADKIAQMGVELAQAGRLDEARILFEGLTVMNPKDASACAALGTIYQKLRMIPEAMREYDAALRIQASLPVALANRGELRVQQGDLGGKSDLEAAVSADPQLGTAAAKRARMLLKARFAC